MKTKSPKLVDKGDGAGLGLDLLDDSKMFRPAAHLAPSDVSLVSADKKQGFALHSFVLKVHMHGLISFFPCSYCPAHCYLWTASFTGVRRYAGELGHGGQLRIHGHCVPR
jgi:hypothetical protein